jgi:hypothetical protein
MDIKLPKSTMRSLCGYLCYVVILLSSFVSQAQVSVYGYEEFFNTPTSNPVTYTEITGADLFGPLVDDQISPALNLGFDFVFADVTHNSVYVSANGFVTFGVEPLAANYGAISTAAAYAGAVAGASKNLIYANFGTSPLFSVPSSVSYETTGVAGSRVFTLQYKNMSIKNGTNTVAPYNIIFNFQIKLYEGSNTVEVIHDQFQGNSSVFNGIANTSPQVGLRGATNTDYNSRTVATSSSIYSQTLPSGTNTQVLYYRPTLYPSGAYLLRWTTGCTAVANLMTSTMTSTSASFAWIGSSGSYDYEVRTSGAAGSGPIGLVTSGTRSVGSVTVNLLSPNTNYTLYVLNKCSASNLSTWASLPFTTYCTATTVPYYLLWDQTDDNYVVPNLPGCTRQVALGASNPWVTSSVAEGGFYDPHLKYAFSNSTAANAWYFTKGVQLQASKIYRISYTYGGAATNSSLVNKLKVMYGSGPSVGQMNQVIENHTEVRSSPNAYVKVFRVPANGTYYFGYHLYSDANMGDFYLGEIAVEESTCGMPTDVTIPSANISSSSAQLYWTSPAPSPSGGFAYYVAPMMPVVQGIFSVNQMIAGYRYQIVSLGNTNFTTLGSGDNDLGTVFVANGAGTGTGTVSLVAQPSTSIQAGKIYRIIGIGTSNFVLNGASINQIGTLFTANATAGSGTGTVIEVQIPTPSNLTAPTGMVGNGMLTGIVTNLTPLTTYYVWVRSNCGGSTFGEWSLMESFTTTAPPIQYCTPTQTGSPDPNGIVHVSVGTINNSTGLEPNGYGNYSDLKTNVYPGQTFPVTITLATGFTYDVSVWIDWNNNGVFESGERVGTAVAANSVPAVVVIPFTVSLGQIFGEYRMRIGGQDFGPLTEPCRVGTWQAFEDYTLKVTVPPPVLALSATSANVCAGQSAGPVMIATGAFSYQVFSWSPATGVTGDSATGYTFLNPQSTVYTLTAQQTSGNYSVNTVKFSYTVLDTPGAVSVVTPDGTARCSTGSPLPIVAGGGEVNNSVAFYENFENGLGAFTQSSSVVGGTTPGAASWTVRPNGYTSGSTFMPFGIFSNDLSNYVITNPDGVCSVCSASVTSVLVSNTIDLTNYQTATLTFYHYFRYLSGDQGKVEVREMPSGAWVPLNTYTSTQGTNTNFQLVTTNLTALGFAGKTIQLRFTFTGGWSYYWALDNIKVTGRVSPLLEWTPTTGLYTDAAGTIPYTGGGALSLYAAPNVSTTYSIRSTIGTCYSEQLVPITVTPIVGGTVGYSQNVCSMSDVLPFELTGHEGSVLRWESADDAAFTMGVAPLAITTSTLGVAQMGTIITTKYFRAIVGVVGCSNLTSNVVSVSLSSTVWNGSVWSNGTPDISKTVIFNGNYISTGDLQACSVFVNPGAMVTISSGHTLLVDRNVEVVNTGIPNRLEFENNASLLQNSILANVGPIYYKRNSMPMRRYAYTYWGSPVSPQTMVAFSPDTRFDKYFDFDVVAYGWRILPGSTVMQPARGYILRAPDVAPFTQTSFNVFNGVFFGVPNNGDYQQSIVYNGANNLNLLGNPYPSAVSADAFLLANAGVAGPLAGTLYFWTHNSDMVNNQFSDVDYALYNFTGGTGVGTAASSYPCANCNTNIPNGYIASGQGFFASSKANGIAVFANDMRVSGQNAMFFRTATTAAVTSLEKHRLWLNLTNTQGAHKQLLVGYVEGATASFDELFDGEVLEGGNAVSFFSVLDDKNLGIQGRALPFLTQDLVALGYRVNSAGTYQIQVQSKDGLFAEGQSVYLEDRLLGIVHPIDQSPYTFEAVSGTDVARFVLRYTDAVLEVNNFDSTSSIVAYANEGSLYVTHLSATHLDTVELFDISGRLVASKSAIQSEKVVFDHLSIAQQILLVSVKDSNGIAVVKKVVFN